MYMYMYVHIFISACVKGSELLYELEVAGPPTTVALSEKGIKGIDLV